MVHVFQTFFIECNGDIKNQPTEFWVTFWVGKIRCRSLATFTTHEEAETHSLELAKAALGK